MTALLEVTDLRKTFTVRGDDGSRAELVAVEGVTFTIAAGGSMALVGESGSGKTTVARLLAGLETAS